MSLYTMAAVLSERRVRVTVAVTVVATFAPLTASHLCSDTTRASIDVMVCSSPEVRKSKKSIIWLESTTG